MHHIANTITLLILVVVGAIQVTSINIYNSYLINFLNPFEAFLLLLLLGIGLTVFGLYISQTITNKLTYPNLVMNKLKGK